MPFACTLLALLALAGGPAAAPPNAVAPAPPAPPSSATSGFVTEIRLAVASEREAGGLSESDRERLREVLTARLPILGSTEGRVEVRAADDIRVRVGVPQVDPARLEMFTRVGRLDVYHLDSVQTSLRPEGRFLVETRTVTDAAGTRSILRFRDRRSGRIFTPAEFLQRCPRLAGNEDLQLGSARALQGGALIAVRIRFTPEASRRIERFVSRPGRILATALDGEIISLNATGSEPSGHPSGERSRRRKGEKEQEEKAVREMDLLAGFRTPDECGYLAILLNAPPLPKPLRVVSRRILGE